MQKPYLNGGAGRVILPAPRPRHYGLIDDITTYALWVNADRNAEPGIDVVEDLFTYPWSFADNSFDGALFAHVTEHIPHEIKVRDDSPRAKVLAGLQDSWYAFFAEAHRVCTAGSIIHVLSPYGWSQGAGVDPTHTRLIFEQSFTHSMQPDPNSPFKYATGGLNLELVEPARFTVTELFTHLLPAPNDAPDVLQAKQVQFFRALQTQINVAYELYVKLRVIK